MNELKISIVKDHSEPECRILPAKDNNSKDREMWQQTGYMYNGGAFPEKFKFSIPDKASALAVGEYTLLVTAFKTDKYDSLELERFSLYDHIAPVKKG